MSLLALGRNGRSQAGAEASGLDSLMGWAYTTIEFTLFLWSIAVGLAYDGLRARALRRLRFPVWGLPQLWECEFRNVCHVLRPRDCNMRI